MTPARPGVPFLASWSPVAIGDALHLVGIEADEHGGLRRWIATGPILELDFLKLQATTGCEGLLYALGIRIGGFLVDPARECIAEMMALNRARCAVPTNALTTQELRAWAIKIRVVGADQYLARPALFEEFEPF